MIFAPVSDPVDLPDCQLNWEALKKLIGTIPTIVSGVVNTVGPAFSGTGFTVTRNGVGDVTINFTKAFSGQPAVTATPCETVGAIVIKGKDGIPITASLARFQAFNPDTPFTAVETIFSFIAVR